MKKLILLTLIFLAVNCGTKQNYTEQLKGEFFERVTDNPYYLIDSLRTAHALQVPIDFETWEKSYYKDNETSPVTIYVIYIEQDDAKHIFSITHKNGEEYVLLKFRKEN